MSEVGSSIRHAVHVVATPSETLSGFVILSPAWSALFTDLQVWGVGIQQGDVTVQVGAPVEPEGHAPEVRIGTILEWSSTRFVMNAEHANGGSTLVEAAATVASESSILELRHSGFSLPNSPPRERFQSWPEILAGLPDAVIEHRRRQRR